VWLDGKLADTAEESAYLQRTVMAREAGGARPPAFLVPVRT
jgi:hypothetical protein